MEGLLAKDRKIQIDDSPLAPLVARTPEGLLAGFALARTGRQAFYIGPVAARNQRTARALLDELLMFFRSAFAQIPAASGRMKPCV